MAKRTRFSLVALFLLLLPLQGGAQPDPGPTGDVDLEPLRPADTSSPRDTLRSFLTNANVTIEARRAGTPSAAAFRAFRRAVETLDLSTTPDGDSWMVRNLRTALLQEVLARVELPPYEQIPGDREVAEGGLTRWTIPNTRITIEQIEHGPRQGEFLFSAETLEQIDGLYRQAKHLPYQLGATVGIYEDLVGFATATGTVTRESELRRRLRPVDVSNPRSTFEGFLSGVNSAYALVMEADAALKATPPTLTRGEAREIEAKAANLLQRAASAFDLSQVPEALRHDVGMETALQLKEILDRMLAPPLDAIPNAQMVAAARTALLGSFVRVAGPLRWRLSNTAIEIEEILEGERAGQFLFSAASVRGMSDYYEQVRELPYRPARFGGTELEYESPELSPGFYEYYISTPGHLIPHAYLLGGVIDDLPDGLKVLYGEQTLWQWIGLLLCLLVVFVGAAVVFRVFRFLAEGRPPPLDRWLPILPPVIAAILVIVVVDFADTELNITGDVLAAVRTGGEVIVLALSAWAVFLLFTALAETWIASPRTPDRGIDASLVRIGARVLGIVIAAGIVVAGVRELGVDMLPLIAGLGVGGLAVALAAQKAIANFIGSLILFVNKPIREGDFCRYGDQIGTVEEIGLIATRIRSLERTLVTVPNAQFSEMQLDNFTARDQRLFKTVLNLRYETTPDQLRYILAGLRTLLLGHPKVTPDPARVRFVGMGAYSLDLEIFAYLRCQDQNTFLAIQEDLLLRMIDIVNESGAGLAFPSQMTYVGPDTGLSEERGREVEARVQQWRAEGQLPFPEFEEALRREKIDVLDYPAEGSAGYVPGGA
ncbi:MAG: mechanosensitive ion channel family protein [Myxococcota bacterium]|nr:mechanosensitive ion channel family protein [Myxococcota bacterium]